jgi:hypothetical protein
MISTPKIPVLKKVESTTIKGIGHRDSTLFLEFISGSVYSYANVNEALYLSILHASSVGKAFAKVRDDSKKYPFKKLQ